MYFGTRVQLHKLSDIQVYAGDQPLDRVEIFEYLGVILDQHLTFSSHIEYLKSKTLDKISLLGKARYIVDHEISLNLYKTLILHLYDYCDYVYHCLSQKDSHTLQKLQNCSLHQILKCEKLCPVIEMHNICIIEMLDTRRDRHVSNEMYRAVHGLSLSSIQNMFQSVQNIHSQDSNYPEQLYLPRCRLEFSKHNFKYRGVLNWNPLPIDMKRAASLSVSKKESSHYYSQQ